LIWLGRRVRGLGPGLTSDSADAVRVVLRNDLSAGSQVFVAPTGAAGLICPSWTRGRVHRSDGPATTAGYSRLLGWLGGFGTVCLVGIEGTGSYGAGLARHVTAAGVRVVEVDRSDRQDRRRQGESDPLDAVSAARAAQSGRPAARRRAGTGPQALRRPRGLPPPPHRRRLTHLPRGRPDPIIGCRIRAGLRTIRRPSPAITDLLGVT
jgi:hypothetical protein